MPAFNEATLKVTKGSIKFAKVDCTDPQSMQLCSRFSIQGKLDIFLLKLFFFFLGYPTVLVLKAGKANGEYNGDRSAEDLCNFCNAL